MIHFDESQAFESVILCQTRPLISKSYTSLHHLHGDDRNKRSLLPLFELVRITGNVFKQLTIKVDIFLNRLQLFRERDNNFG